MTKSQRSGTKKLPLARLFRWLAVLCFIKLCIFTMILLDFPFPLFDKSPSGLETTAKEPKSPVPRVSENLREEPENNIPEARTLAPNVETGDTRTTDTQVPDPIRAGSSYHASLTDDISLAPILKTPDFPLPDPLPAPIAEPGTIAREEEHIPSKTLPVPTLGSVTVAQAAASMPVPQTVIPTQAMTPAEQNLPPNRSDTTSMPVPNVPPRPSSAGPVPPLPPAQNGVLQPKRQPTPITVNSDAQDLARQQQDMLVLKKQMDERIKELQDSEAKVKRMLMEAKGLELEKIKTLIQMFGNMKPKTAAKALENMDERTACRILEGLTPKQAGDILSYTNPTVTAKLTEHLTHVKLK